MKSFVHARHGWVPALLAIGAAAPAAATDGYFSSGFGIKNEAVAGAGQAFPQDSLTIATNPAGLAALLGQGHRFVRRVFRGFRGGQQSRQR